MTSGVGDAQTGIEVWAARTLVDVARHSGPSGVQNEPFVRRAASLRYRSLYRCTDTCVVCL
jgi:hypothetical protein